MTKIVVNIEALRRMVNRLVTAGVHTQALGGQILRASSDARSYDGQYAPWVQSLAAEAEHDIRNWSEILRDQGHWLRRIASAFEEADLAEVAGYTAWAMMMREMVEEGIDPTTVMPDWARQLERPPWIPLEDWLHITPEDRRTIVDEYVEAYLAQEERIARMQTPPWEKDPKWLWAITGLDPHLFEDFPFLEPEDLEEYRAHLDRVKREYAQHWDEFLRNQAIYKFGVGDDLSEAFLIFLFGLEGAVGYGVEVVYSRDGQMLGAIGDGDQRILEDPKKLLRELELIDDERHVQDINLDAIPQFRGKGYGSNYQEDFGIHYNLCGEMTTAVTTGVDPIDALIRFDGVHGGRDILLDQTAGTNSADLTRLLNEYGWEGERVGNAGDPYPWRDERGWQPKPDQVADHLHEGRAVIALVNLDTSSDLIEPVDGRSDATHWVSIIQVVEAQDGSSFAKVYNPYQSREEWYSFDQLVEAWTPGPNYRAVIATPPEEMAWLPNP